MLISSALQGHKKLDTMAYTIELLSFDIFCNMLEEVCQSILLTASNDNDCIEKIQQCRKLLEKYDGRW